MMRAFQIEWLKSRRTKSFLIAFLLMFVAVVWSLLAAAQSLDVPKLRTIGLFFNNLQATPIFLPIATCLFVSRIVSNEREGSTFKLQAANGTHLVKIFNRKLLFANLVFLALNFFQVALVCLNALTQGIAVPLSNVCLQIVGLSMASFTLITCFLYLALVMDKHGLLLGIGFLSGFLGLITSEASKWLNLIFPFGGSSFLALYRIKLLQGGEHPDYIFAWDSTVPVSYALYALYCLLIYFGVRYLLTKKEGE